MHKPITMRHFCSRVMWRFWILDFDFMILYLRFSLYDFFSSLILRQAQNVNSFYNFSFFILHFSFLILHSFRGEVRRPSCRFINHSHLSETLSSEFHYTFLIIMAEAPPPPLQIAATPVCPSLTCKTFTKVVTILAPDAPSGCPKETEPPNTFTFWSSVPTI